MNSETASRFFQGSMGAGTPSWVAPPRSFATQFGGTRLLGLPGYLQSNGVFSSGIQAGASYLTVSTVPWACVLTDMTYSTSTGDATSTFNIRKNNTSQGNFTLPSTVTGRISANVMFAAGDTVGVYWVGSGTIVGATVFNLYFREIVP